MSASPVAEALARDAFDRLLGELRPKLHRYCARMAGSVVDGEDIVQEALVKAMVAFQESAAIDSPESWLFRVAHNAALDFLRRRTRMEAARAHEEDMDMLVDPVSTTDNREATITSLRTFMRLPIAQRSAVILMDVLGYSLGEIAQIIHSSIPAVKATLHRGRARLRELALEPDDLPSPSLDAVARSRLMDYVDRFNAREFDAVRDMLADDVNLELVNRTRLNGVREVAGRYFHNYGRSNDWKLVAGFVDRRPAVLVQDPREPARGWRHFVLLEWADDLIVTIRDFRYASYVIECAELQRVQVIGSS